MEETQNKELQPLEQPVEQPQSADALKQAAQALEQAAAASGQEGATPEQTAAALEQAAEALKAAAAEKEQQGPQNLKERMYDKVRIPIWLLDVVIWGCVAGIIFCLIFGRS